MISKIKQFFCSLFEKNKSRLCIEKVLRNICIGESTKELCFVFPVIDLDILYQEKHKLYNDCANLLQNMSSNIIDFFKYSNIKFTNGYSVCNYAHLESQKHNITFYAIKSHAIDLTIVKAPEIVFLAYQRTNTSGPTLFFACTVNPTPTNNNYYKPLVYKECEELSALPVILKNKVDELKKLDLTIRRSQTNAATSI